MSNRIGILLLSFALLFSLAVNGQTPPTPDRPSHEDVVKLMKLMKCREQAKEMMDGMMSQLLPGMKQEMKQKDPNMPEAELADFDKIMADYMNQLPLDDMVNAMIPAYENHLTRTEVQAMTSFYSSPPGQSVLAKMPVIGAEYMKTLQPMMLNWVREMEASMKPKIEELRAKYHRDK